MNVEYGELDAALWEIAARFSGWENTSVELALLTVRWIGLASFAPGFSSPIVSFRYRMVLAVMMAAVTAPGQVERSDGDSPFLPYIPTALVMEFAIGALLGLCVNMWIASARSAGEWIGLMAGSNMQTAYQPDWDGDSGAAPTPIGRLFALLGIVIFVSAEGPLRLMDLMHVSLLRCPPGQGWQVIRSLSPEAIFGLVGESLALSLFVAWPILLVLATAQMSVMLATKTRSVIFSWSLLAPTRLAIAMFVLAVSLGAVSIRLADTLAVWNRHAVESVCFGIPGYGETSDSDLRNPPESIAGDQPGP